MVLFAVARAPTMAVLASVVAGAALDPGISNPERIGSARLARLGSRPRVVASIMPGAELSSPRQQMLCVAERRSRHNWSRRSCIAAGLVGGEGFAVDASLIESLVAFWGKGDIGSNL